MTDLKPHTPEWFKALDRQNPQQAAMTRQAIASAGRDDGCSVCGDDPATDYKLVDPRPAPGVVATLRLCDDCRGIRQAMQGETYEAL
ncbi:hypothetical protein MKK88_03385 [Methylobacterium sp. E-005]|uniref:hypothetical protein n=1 Tax=Methylobacterium sp. E-005 TaxID=2836549 RepID=UPI001FB8B383|nr:hypothetical protein [Methylobacterium sp. E-005]MCJ2085039.1 hypothetical protein [Methylobacterium sp. E-005]